MNQTKRSVAEAQTGPPHPWQCADEQLPNAGSVHTAQQQCEAANSPTRASETFMFNRRDHDDDPGVCNLVGCQCCKRTVGANFTSVAPNCSHVLWFTASEMLLASFVKVS